MGGIEANILNVLVVDDEAVVRDFLGRFLGMLSSVSLKITDNGWQAIEASQAQRFDLVFLDIRMPKMNGLELFAKLKKINPDISCVFMTGYASAEEELQNTVKQSGVLCLRKPFEDLNQIKEIINKAREKVRAGAGGDTAVKEKRAYVRLDLALEVDYKMQAPEGRLRHSVSKNISLGGIRILVQEEFVPGSKLDLVIRNPAHNKACKVAAEVVWVRACEGKSGYYDAGLKFTEINISELSGLIPQG